MTELKDVKLMVDSLPDGFQKDYFNDILSRINKGESINPTDVINGMDNDNFDVDIEALRTKENEFKNIFQQWAKV